MKFGSRLRSSGILAIATLIAQLGVLVPATGASAAVTGLDGTVTNSLTGAPVSGGRVVIQFPDGSHWDFTNADATGHFSFPGAVAGQYIVQVQQGAYIEQWLNGKPDRYSADLITAPATLSVALVPIQYGGIAGTVTKPGGGGLAHIYLELRRDGNSVGNTSTDANGGYRFDNVETGTYEMYVRYPSGHEVWYDNADESNATPIEVTPNTTTTINVVRPPTGNLNIKAIDRTTKTPIANYCWYHQEAPYQFPTVCTDATGVAKLRAVPIGDYSGGGYDQAENYVNGLFGPVTVTEDRTSTTVVRLDKNSKLHVGFVDSASGEAVNACVHLADPVRNDIGSGGHCGTSR